MSDPITPPTQPPAPIDPKRPVRDLGKWMNYLGLLGLGYEAARCRILAIVLTESMTAPSADLFSPGGDEDYDPMHPVTKWVAGKLRAYSWGAVRAKVAEDGIMPKLANIAKGIFRCIETVEPFVDGIHKHLGAIGKDPALWETELAQTLIKLNRVIAVDKFSVENETFVEPDDFVRESNAVIDDLSALLHDLIPKVEDLATVALVETPQQVEGKVQWGNFPWRRLVLLVAILLTLELCAVIGAWCWGTGNNLLQRVGNCWWLLTLVFTAVVIVSPFVLGKEGWQEVKKIWNSWRD